MNTTAATPTVTIFNDTGRTLAQVLFGFLKQALSATHQLVYFRGLDNVQTRAARTRKGRIEVEVYEDGSGLEVAAFGRVMVLGVERKHRACNA
ncbi:MAG: hypothetical protein A2580_07540 [Hydrogenophilales bacterium RIFOXYD1_FULL_62_11]|nr:MAG: hypothetical protein A2580_07540 [Hydrogenophilales bacterium RIFOXYD1_FULL_62_11]